MALEMYCYASTRKCSGKYDVFDTSFIPAGTLSDLVFSSPELKAQVSFSDRLSSVVCLSVFPSVRLTVNFSYFRLLLKNHWVHFNQIWHKTSLGEGNSSFLNEGPRPFSRGYNNEIAEIH